MNFLYCFDENYNIQGYLSIYSLLENVDNKISIYIIHKDPKSFEKYPTNIQKMIHGKTTHDNISIC